MEGLTLTDIFWDSNYFVLDIKQKDEWKTEDQEIIPEFSEKPSRPSKSLVDIKQWKTLILSKDKIENCVQWDKWSKMTNPYDKVQNFAKKRVSNDYYKLYEIIKYYKLTTIKEDIDDDTNRDVQTSAHMCEAPGSFIKAIQYFCPKVEWYAQTLCSDIKFYDSLNTNDSNGFPRIIKDGDLTNIDDLVYFTETVGKVDIITGDGAFSTTHDHNNQEQLTLQLICSQIVCALNCQKKSGHFILKIFDSFTAPTCQLIYYLTKFYTNVSIIKPRTSKYTNSEKYVVCRNFKGISKEQQLITTNLVKNWNNDYYCRTFGIEIPEQVKKLFKNYNTKMIRNQMEYIEKAISCSYNEEETPQKQLSAFQNRKAQDYCKIFGITSGLSDTRFEGLCKHFKKTKIHIGPLRNTMVCEKCFLLLIK
jgi:23S rRNA U2552 (ribose-2'-O)-methylase RlmE/FtsJ